ncbi:hypothetical protein IPL68_07930 [Candidatus Saccharibacteria bacterium]|nr:MAG: hypothetical protein IPL68_07930 [Candidatus Saccharibacteria bacterium]
MLEDIALMRVMPGMVVLSPCDALETERWSSPWQRQSAKLHSVMPRGDSHPDYRKNTI